jgi:1-acyl-sn-glycerol-3-phosphate acyltransferase
LLLAVIGAIVVRFIPRAEPPAPDLKLNFNLFSETLSNLKLLRQNRTVFLSCLGISWFWFYGATLMTQLTAFTKDVLGGDASVVTLALTTFSIGVGIGSLMCEKLSHKQVEIGLVPFGAIGLSVFAFDLYLARPVDAEITGLSAAMFVQSAGAWRVLADLLLIGVFGGFYIVPLFALIQQRSAPEYRSRIIAGNNILNAMFMVASALLAIAALVGLELSLSQLILGLALINALVAVYIFSLVPEFLLRFVTYIGIHFMYRIRGSGLERVPKEGPALLICNHVSFIDAFLIGGMVRRPTRFVMYYKFFKIPVLSFFFRAAKVIPIAGAKEDPAILERAFQLIDQQLAEGEVVCIFPEGQITRDGELNAFRPGVEKILATRPVPVIPLALKGLWGSIFSRRDANLKRVRLPRRIYSRVALEVGTPIPPEQVTAAGLQAIVQAMLDAPTPGASVG